MRWSDGRLARPLAAEWPGGDGTFDGVVVDHEPDGSYEIKTVAAILKDHQDRYHDKCPMK